MRPEARHFERLACIYLESLSNYNRALEVAQEKSAAESYLRLIPDDATMTRLLARVVTLTGQSVADIEAALRQIEDRHALSPESEAIRRLLVE